MDIHPAQLHNVMAEQDMFTNAAIRIDVIARQIASSGSRVREPP
jgi:hypothetical protein